MNWQEKKMAFTRSVKGVANVLKVSGDEPPEILRKKQVLRLGTGAGMALIGACWAFGVFDFTAPQSGEPAQKASEKPLDQPVSRLSTPLSGVKDGDIWVSRIEKIVRSSREELAHYPSVF